MAFQFAYIKHSGQVRLLSQNKMHATQLNRGKTLLGSWKIKVYCFPFLNLSLGKLKLEGKLLIYIFCFSVDFTFHKNQVNLMVETGITAVIPTLSRYFTLFQCPLVDTTKLLTQPPQPFLIVLIMHSTLVKCCL